MDRIGNDIGQLRFIVLPLQPETADQYDGVGLALHFLLGNTVVLNTNLKEFWFGWRTNKLYPTREALNAYLLGQNQPMAFKQLSQEQEVRFWQMPPDTGNLVNTFIGLLENLVQVIPMACRRKMG